MAFFFLISTLYKFIKQNNISSKYIKTHGRSLDLYLKSNDN